MFKTLCLIIVLCLLCPSISRAHGSFVYVTNYGDGTISQFRAKFDGTLTPLRPPTVKAHILCHSLAVARGRFLYAVSSRDWSRRDCLVSQFKIARDGRLTALSPAQILVPGTPASIAVEPAGRFAYVFTREGMAVLFRIGTDGQLRLLPIPPVKVADAGGVTPIIGFDRRHHVLYGSYNVAWGDNVTSGRFACLIQSSGHIDRLPGIGTSNNSPQPYSITISPSGRYAYVVESQRDKRLATQWREVVAQYRTRSGGSLTLLSPQTVTVETAGKSFADPTGHFLYLLYEKTNDTNVTASYRLAYARLKRGGVLGKFTYQTLRSPALLPPMHEFSLGFEAAGRFCYFVDGDYVYLFRRLSNGSLSPLHSTRIDAGYGPLEVICVQK